MLVFRYCTAVALACAGLIGIWALTHGATGGVVEVGGSAWFEMLVIVPAIVGFGTTLAAAASVPILWQRLSREGLRLAATGHLIAIGLVGLCFLALLRPAATGWELLLIGPALLVGEFVAAIGLLWRIMSRRRSGVA